MTHDDLGAAFAPLDTELHDVPWREPARIRRVAVRRRRLRRGLGVATVAVVATGVLVAVLPSSSSPATHRPQQFGAAQQLVAHVAPLRARDATAAKSLVAAERQFAIDLLRHTTSTDNSVLSPASLAIALAMLQTGARGATRTEIATMLHTAHLSSAQQDAGWAALVGDLAAAKGVTVQSANSLWLQRNLPMRQAYLDALARYFRTGVWQVDFQRDLPGAQKAINTWTSDNTHGRITKLFGPHELDPSTLLVLANAIYFKAAWKTTFETKLTKPGTFTKADGSPVRVPFMNAIGASDTFGENWQSVQIPYAGERYSALLVMPTKGTLRELINGLTSAQLDAFADTAQDGFGRLSVPRFTLHTYLNLNSTMQAMGMRTAFGAADFSAMSPVGMQVDTVVQRDFLKVDEQGTEAAAVTGMGVALSAGRANRLRPFDHPFLFLVRDTKTGAILFSAQVNDPSDG